MRTDRLLLRRWQDDDLEPFAALNRDPEVMEHFEAPLTREQSAAAIERFEAELAEWGAGLWAVEVLDTGDLIGFTGLHRADFPAPFTPAVEVGWRLTRAAWGHGYATEAATAALDLAFGPLGLDEVVSFTTRANLRSQAVMRRLGMVRDPEGDFEHPAVSVGSPHRPHVLFRITAGEWAARRPR